jgi:hypothetical protein
LRLEAGLTASGEFQVKGEGKNVEVTGGVQAGRVLLAANALRITPDRRPGNGAARFADSPLRGSRAGRRFAPARRLREDE